jgi:Pentapeptide repeats (8 copies)
MQDFSGQNLQGRDFKRQDLTCANFVGADIRGANFSQAILHNADFTGVTAGLAPGWRISAMLWGLGRGDRPKVIVFLCSGITIFWA